MRVNSRTSSGGQRSLTHARTARSDIPERLQSTTRTVRAGENGRSIPLVGEGDRKMLKTVIKQSPETDKVRHRLALDDAIKSMLAKLKELKTDVMEVLKSEQMLSVD